MNEDEHSQFSMYSALTNSEVSSKGTNLTFLFIHILIDNNININCFFNKTAFQSRLKKALPNL
jgi:hypothetical protein